MGNFFVTSQKIYYFKKFCQNFWFPSRPNFRSKYEFFFLRRPVDENKKQKHSLYEENKLKNVPIVRSFEKPIKITTKKVPPLKIVDDTIVSAESFRNLQNFPSPPKERDKPPIVLRIFKGTSQLISEPGTKSESSGDECAAVDTYAEDNHPEAAEPILSENPADNAALSSRSLRRRSREKSKSPTPEEPSVPAKVSRRSSEKSKSLSPDPAAALKTRSARRRSPEKSKSPSPEPTITTRSLRRRHVPVEPAVLAAPVPQPHTSPKRALRSTRNTPAPPAPAPGKIVITNLNSNHPSVYINELAAAPSSAPLVVNKKDAKECRSYSGKHKHRKHEKNESTEISKKVEDALADIDSAPEPLAVAEPIEDETDMAAEPIRSTDTSLDSDRAELLHLLEDDEEENGATEASDHRKATVAEMSEKPDSVATPVQEEISPTIISSDSSELKIKIKISDLRKPSIETKTKEEEIIPTTLASDSADSGISVEACSAGSADWSSKTDSEPKDGQDEAKDVDDRLTDAATNSDSERCELGGEPSSSVLPAAIINKKGSIFKHRSTNDGNKKRLALYKHKWTDDKDGTQTNEEDKNAPATLDTAKALDSIFDGDIDDMPLTKFIRQPSENKFDFDDAPPVMGVKCSKKNKDVSQIWIKVSFTLANRSLRVTLCTMYSPV